jgi:hypothetical protein
LIRSDGLPLWEIVDELTGKKVPGPRPPHVVTVNGNGTPGETRLSRILQAYDSLFQYLCGNGAFLNVIKPEYLLAIADFVNLKNPKLTTAQRAVFQSNIENFYQVLSRDSWIYIICQIIKVFVFRRITTTGLKSLPGVESKSLHQVKKRVEAQRKVFLASCCCQFFRSTDN